MERTSSEGLLDERQNTLSEVGRTITSDMPSSPGYAGKDANKGYGRSAHDQ